jgi:hypothetical protein
LAMATTLRCTAVSALAVGSAAGSRATRSPTTAQRCRSLGLRSAAAIAAGTASVPPAVHAAATEPPRGHEGNEPRARRTSTATRNPAGSHPTCSPPAPSPARPTSRSPPAPRVPSPSARSPDASPPASPNPANTALLCGLVTVSGGPGPTAGPDG